MTYILLCENIFEQGFNVGMDKANKIV